MASLLVTRCKYPQNARNVRTGSRLYSPVGFEGSRRGAEFLDWLTDS